MLTRHLIPVSHAICLGDILQSISRMIPNLQVDPNGANEDRILQKERPCLTSLIPVACGAIR